MEALRVAIAGLVALIAALLLALANASAAPTDARLANGYAYDAHPHAGLATYIANESGPPLAGDRYTTDGAVDHRSDGTSAHADATPSHAYTAYDLPAMLVLVDNSAGTTRVPAQVPSEDLSSHPRSQVAAKTAPSIGVRATSHGAERLTRAGFTDDLVAQTKAGLVTRQADGASVYVREVSPGRFDFIVEGQRGVITAHRNWSQKSVDGLARRYGWEGWPP